MDDIRMRTACLKAASRLASSPEDLLRLAVAFEAYTLAGYNTGIEMLKPNFGGLVQPAQPNPEPAPAAASEGVWVDPVNSTITRH